ncbi:MAG: hypothetical protein CM15mP58_22180 [Burkholderiaceae bacterium]|nr:MAG: hypothetical protein CM15mP58_22180 [Burkholderiaceae bacterium]
MTKYHNAEYCSPLVSTNPCAEQPLPDGGCCNLGALNLERFVIKMEILISMGSKKLLQSVQDF